MKLWPDVAETFDTCGIKIANVSNGFKAIYDVYRLNLNVSEQKVLNVGTMLKRMPDDWLAAFYYWAGLPLPAFIEALTKQASGKDGDLLTNGKLNGAILAEDPQYAITCRWHNPDRPYPEQTATFPSLGWSIHVVATGSRCWCQQGGKIIYV